MHQEALAIGVGFDLRGLILQRPRVQVLHTANHDGPLRIARVECENDIAPHVLIAQIDGCACIERRRARLSFENDKRHVQISEANELADDHSVDSPTHARSFPRNDGPM
jgi:hypothetical protein